MPDPSPTRPGPSPGFSGILAALSLVGLGIVSIDMNTSLAIDVGTVHWEVREGSRHLSPWPYVLPSQMAAPSVIALLVGSLGAVMAIFLEGKRMVRGEDTNSTLVVLLVLMNTAPAVATVAPFLSAPLFLFVVLQCTRRAAPLRRSTSPWMRRALLVALCLPTLAELAAFAALIANPMSPIVFPNWVFELPYDLSMAWYLCLAVWVWTLSRRRAAGVTAPPSWTDLALWVLILFSLLQVPAHEATLRPML